jgi:hypothetical protein
MVWTARIALVVLLVSAPAAAQEVPAQSALAADVEPAKSVAPEVPPSKDVGPDTALPIKNVLPDKPAPQGNFFTRPFYDKKVRLFTEINAGAAILDDIASRKVIEAGGYERNPLMRPFVHNSGTLAAESVAEVWLMAYVADRMKHSSHAALRKTWWLPQTLNISAKVSGGIYNSTLLAH